MEINYQSIPVKCYIIRNVHTGKEYEFRTFDCAEEMLIDLREERPESEWFMYAEVDA